VARKLAVGAKLLCGRFPHQPIGRGDGCSGVEARGETDWWQERVVLVAGGGGMAGSAMAGVALAAGSKIVFSKVKVTLQLTVSQSLCQSIDPILGLVTRYYFRSEGCFLKCAVLSLWGALSDERLGLSFVFLSLVIYHYLHQTFTLHVFYSSAIYAQ
jgi:hypothetical protein